MPCCYRQEAGDLVDVATLGSATASPGGRWLTKLLPARRILAAYDHDAAGAKGASALAALSGRVNVRPARVPATSPTPGTGARICASGSAPCSTNISRVPSSCRWTHRERRRCADADRREPASRIDAAWAAIPTERRTAELAAVQAQLLDDLAAVEAARQARGMTALRTALGRWEATAAPIFAAYRAVRALN